MWLTGVLGSVYLLISFVRGGNILAIMPAPFYSHQIAFKQIWKELSLRGHKVTLITTVPSNDPKLVNLTEYDMSSSFKISREKYSISKTAENILTMWNWYDIYGQINYDTADEQFSKPNVQELIQNKQNHYDIVFVESYFPEFLAFGALYKAPTVLITSVDAHTEFHHAMGNPAHPILNADYATPYHGTLSFKERVISTLFYLYVYYFNKFTIFPKKQTLVNKFFPEEKYNLEKLMGNVDLMFLDVNPVIQGPRAIGPNTINVGMERDFKMISSKPLPQDLKEFMDNATEGFIYFSLGSNINSKELNGPTLQAILETFREIPYKVLLKFEAAGLPEKPKNVKIFQWAPQPLVLKHQNIKLFISQGGLQSKEEAIYNGVPFVVIPFFADQFKNARQIENLGIGITVNRKPFVKKQELKSAILEVITNPKYKANVKQLGKIAHDVPINGIEKAIWWTEYLIRNKGAKYLRNPAADIPLYQYFLLDVISFLIFVSVGMFLVIYFVSKKLISVLGTFYKIHSKKQCY